MLLALVALVALCSSAVHAELTVSMYANAAFAGAAQTTTIANISATGLVVPMDRAVSYEIRGMLQLPPQSEQWVVNCTTVGSVAALVWLDSHLICVRGYDPKWANYMADGRLLPYPLASWSRTNKTQVFLRATLVQPQPVSEQSSLTVTWAKVGSRPSLLGCFVDNQTRDLPVNAGDSPQGNSPADCSSKCVGWAFFGLQSATNCFCGDSYGRYGAAPMSDCNRTCPGDKSVDCGGTWRNSIYQQDLSTSPIPSSAYSTQTIPSYYTQQLSFQQQLLNNTWSTYLRGSVSAHTRLPEGVILHIGVCQLSTKNCKQDVDGNDVSNSVVRLGYHAYDHSYTQMVFNFSGAQFEVQTSQQPDQSLLIQVALVNGDAVNASDYGAMIVGEFAATNSSISGYWWRTGVITRDQTHGSITLAPTGHNVQNITLHLAADQSSSTKFQIPDTAVAVGFSSSQAVAVFSTGAAPQSSASVTSKIAAAKKAELARYSAYGDLAQAKEISQMAMMWNLIYDPVQPGPFFPVSRTFFGLWPIFDWDNIFGAYQLSLDARELAYSQLISVIQTKTRRGLVPNLWEAQDISYDRTEPVIGARVLAAMYNKYGDKWLVDLLYDDLYDWLDFMWENRREQPLNLICLGSDVGPDIPSSESSPNTMQGARYESGLDNSPMYDGEFFNSTSHHMMLYDVGMSSMVASEMLILANLSVTALSKPRPADQALLNSRAQQLVQLIQQHLWNEDLGTFTNKFSFNNSFYARTSPTTFYPLLARAAQDSQVETMINSWLFNSSRFCIAPNGDFAGNSDTCYWGLPSISADDPAFPALGYWRGFVWGPMAALVYWSLDEYSHLEIAQQAKTALAKQMSTMESHIWGYHGHVCENFMPWKNATECSWQANHYYHWGALSGFIALLNQNYY